MDQLTTLRVFGIVVEKGSLSAAARELGLSAAMVSKHVNRLEQHLGLRLLHRSTRRVSATAAGRLYYERTSQLLLDLNNADELVKSLNDEPRGNIVVHTNAHLMQWVSNAVSDFLKSHPNVTVTVRTGERMPDLVEEDVDLAIRTIAPTGSRLVQKRLFDWQQVICCSPSYARARGMPTSPYELKEHNCLRYAHFPSGDLWQFVDSKTREACAVEIGGNLVTDNAEMLRDVAVTGSGVLIAPGFLLQKEIEEGRLVPILENYELRSFSAVALYPDRKYLPAKTRAFLDCLVKNFSRR